VTVTSRVRALQKHRRLLAEQGNDVRTWLKHGTRPDGQGCDVWIHDMDYRSRPILYLPLPPVPPSKTSMAGELQVRLLVWMTLEREVSDDVEILPGCGTRRCVHPDHLVAVRLVDLPGPDC
jgi:hypothetical protein